MIEEQIPAALAGERLDRVVALVTGVSRTDASALVAAGGASVDGEVQPSGKLRLAEGQVVSIDTDLLPHAAPPGPDGTIEVTVVHADDHVIVVDKPAGLVVHPGAGHREGTLVNGLLARFPEIASVGQPERPGIVHRLDVGTSGLLVVARSQLAYDMLVGALSARDVGRSYRTLVWGVPANPVGVIDAPIGRDRRDPMRMAVVVDGKSARTRYRLLRTYRAPADVAELECKLETGRTHQIRVHLQAIGHPVAGDPEYGAAGAPAAGGGLGLERQFLHAARLRFAHPVTGQEVDAGSPLPADLQRALDRARAA